MARVGWHEHITGCELTLGVVCVAIKEGEQVGRTPEWSEWHECTAVERVAADPASPA